MRTREQCSALIGKRVVTPKGEGVAVEVRDDGVDPIELVVKLDAYSGDEQYEGTLLVESDVNATGTWRRPPGEEKPLDFGLTFPITLKELTTIAFVAGHLFNVDAEQDGDSLGVNVMSKDLSAIVDRACATWGAR